MNIKALVISEHAKERAKERKVRLSTFLAVRRLVMETNLKDHLQNQLKKFASMLTDKDLHARVGPTHYKATNHEINTKVVIDGITFIVGIRRDEQGFSPLTVETVYY